MLNKTEQLSFFTGYYLGISLTIFITTIFQNTTGTILIIEGITISIVFLIISIIHTYLLINKKKEQK